MTEKKRKRKTKKKKIRISNKNENVSIISNSCEEEKQSAEKLIKVKQLSDRIYQRQNKKISICEDEDSPLFYRIHIRFFIHGSDQCNIKNIHTIK